jgi:radical SAM protein with 4Fe4S-binding SPASM domain
LLNEKTSRDLLEAGLGMVIFSIDSLKKEVYEKIRVRLKFEQVRDNAIKFLELRDKINPKCRVWTRMIRQESNYNEFDDYYNFWRKYASEVDRIYYHNIFNWGGQLDGYKSVEKSYEPNLPCVALWSLMVFFANGDVPLCNVDYNNKYPTGNVMKNSIRELWKSKIMNARRKLHLDGNKKDISICANCNVWDEVKGEELISPEFAEKVSILNA